MLNQKETKICSYSDVVALQPGQEVQLSVFDRSVDDEIFLGLAKVRPRLSMGQSTDTWLKLVPREHEEVSGEIRVQYRFERDEGKKVLSVKDFEFLRMIGKGTFG